MAELKERLERLADLGDPRGADTVWQRAHERVVVAPEPTAAEPPRRRRAWTVVAVGAAVALIVAGLSALLAGRHQPSVVRVAPQGANNVVLIDNGTGPLTLVDLTTGQAGTVTLPGKVGGDFNYDVIVTGGAFVYHSTGGVTTIPTSLQGAPSFLAQQGEFVPSARPGRLWLFTFPADGVPTHAQELSVDGRSRGPKYLAPFEGVATAVISGGLIRADTVWYPARNTTRLLPGLPNVFDAHGSLAAWMPNCQAAPQSACGSLQVYQLATNTLRRYPPPAGTATWILTGGEGTHDAFAPDGRQLALRATSTSAPGSSQVYVLNLATGGTTPVPHSQASPYSRVAWTPDGKTLVFETDTHSLGTYEPATATSRTVPVPCCGNLTTASTIR